METLEEIFALAEEDLEAAKTKALILKTVSLKKLNEHLEASSKNKTMLAETLLIKHYADNHEVIKKLINGADRNVSNEARIILCEKHWQKTKLNLLVQLQNDVSEKVRKAACLAARKKAKQDDKRL
jgi:hypothetical protein